MKEMTDDNFISFQDDFYNLLEKYGVSSIDCEHKRFSAMWDLRNKVAGFIEQELYIKDGER
jgi:purine-nucleoside phosphorylase